MASENLDEEEEPPMRKVRRIRRQGQDVELIAEELAAVPASAAAIDTKVALMPPWVEESLDLLQKGGQAWTDAEKAKIADLNWRIVAEKQ